METITRDDGMLMAKIAVAADSHGKPIYAYREMTGSTQLIDGFTTDELSAAFDLIKPASHWKDEINCLVSKSANLDAIAAAVEFYTATKTTFLVAEMPGTVRVVADGYRRGPAGDH